MINFRKPLLLAIAALGMFCLDYAPSNIHSLKLIPDAEAIIGRPMTPFSYAGVARRTAWRGGAGWAYGAAPIVVGAATAAAVDGIVVANNQPLLDVGTVVRSLPDGCYSTLVNTVSYQKCGGVYYRPAYQGGHLVYVVSAP
jgi:hypothetical protein